MGRVSGWFDVLVVVAALGCAATAGVLLTFSTFTMRGLRDLPAPDAVRAMQRINAAALRPPLMLLLFGTAMLCVVVALTALGMRTGVLRPVLAAGSVTYLLGTLGVTAAVHVPLNDRLARADPAVDAETVWRRFHERWVRWNHVRTAAAALAAVLLVSSTPPA